MINKINEISERYIANRDTVQKVFRFENACIIPVTANFFTAADVNADEARFRECKKTLKKKTNALSNLRGFVSAPVTAKMYLAEDAEAQLHKIDRVYDELRKFFRRSESTALLSLMLSDMVEPEGVAALASRGKKLFKMMNKKYPMLTNGQDGTLACFLAFSPKEDEALVAEINNCFTLLRARFTSKSDDTQRAAYILALADGTPEEKTEHMIALFDLLHDSGKLYGTRSELAVLAAVSLLPAELVKLREAITDFDDFLTRQKGYGAFGVGRKTRLMHAGMLTIDFYRSPEAGDAALTDPSVAMIAAQQAALCAVVAASADSGSATTT